MSLWSGRFDSAPDKEVFDYGKSLSVDKRLAEDDITGSQAWAEALGRAGVLASADVKSIVTGLEEIRAAVRANPAVFDAAPTRAHARRAPARRGSAAPGSGCTRAARETNRSRSIFCTFGGGFPESSAPLRRSSTRRASGFEAGSDDAIVHAHATRAGARRARVVVARGGLRRDVDGSRLAWRRTSCRWVRPITGTA
jgi:hypothetical protein